MGTRFAILAHYFCLFAPHFHNNIINDDDDDDNNHNGGVGG